MGGAVTQEGARKIKPRTVRVVQRDCGHTEGREGDSGDDLLPVEADPKKALKGSRSTEVLDDSKSVQDAMFEIDVAPSKAAEPERTEHNCPTHFAIESIFAQGCVDCFGPDHLAPASRDGRGSEGVVHLAEPDSEGTRPDFEVGYADREDAFRVVIAFLFHVGDLSGLTARDSHVYTECLERVVNIELFDGLETTGVAFRELHCRCVHLVFIHHLAKAVGSEGPVHDVKPTLAELEESARRP